MLLCACSAPQTKKKPEVAFQEEANAKVKAPKDITYPKKIAHEDYDAIFERDGKNPVKASMLKNYTSFSMDSFNDLLRVQKGNINYAPLSLYYPLMLTLSASQEETYKELSTYLHADKKQTNDMGNLYRRLYTDNESGRMKIANSLWIQDDFPIKKDFLQTAEKQFYSSIYKGNLSSQKNADLMAAWIREHTDGNLSPHVDPQQNASLVLLNALSYKARFVDAFDKKATKKQDFHTPDGKVKADFMHQSFTTYPFKDTKTYASASMGLTNNSTITFVLPKGSYQISDILAQKDFYTELTSDNHTVGTLNLALPKFQIHSKLPVQDTMQQAGVKTLFTEDASLEGISATKPLYVTSIRQETSIAVDEDGIEAGAYTIEDVVGAAHIEKPKVLNLTLDKPFLYFITTRIEGVEIPVFIGVCTNPSQPA